MFESFAYLGFLWFSIGGLLAVDYWFRLAMFFDRRRTLKTLAAGVAFFLIWDLLGIGLHIFFVGDSPYLTGLRLAPELPIEEVFFLTLLNYSALLLWRGAEKLWPRT